MTVPAAPAGLQAERTSLAWRRTAMAVAVGSLGVLRFVAPHLGVVGVVLGVVGLVWAAALAWQGRRRYAGALEALAALADEVQPAAPVPGSAVIATTAMTLVVGVVSLAAVLALALR